MSRRSTRLLAIRCTWSTRASLSFPTKSLLRSHTPTSVATALLSRRIHAPVPHFAQEQNLLGFLPVGRSASELVGDSARARKFRSRRRLACRAVVRCSRRRWVARARERGSLAGRERSAREGDELVRGGRRAREGRDLVRGERPARESEQLISEERPARPVREGVRNRRLRAFHARERPRRMEGYRIFLRRCIDRQLMR
jgi:hypothetical protein